MSAATSSTFTAEKDHLTFPFAADPKRKVYSQFAEQLIPRTYLISPDGTILFQSSGYRSKDFRELLEIIKHELNGR